MENTQVGPFLIIRRLGSRRQQVYRARQVEQDRDVALKFITLPPSIPREVALDKIDREVRFLQELRHPNLVRLYGAGVHEDRIFFASELVEGESLTSIMARRGRLAPDLAVDYSRQVCNLLQYIHKHELLHAKLTPDKILVGKDGVIKVTDLRINRSRKKRWDAVTTRRELDLAAYMAPEQHMEGATEKSDLYSLGVISYEMLTGKLPYEPDTMGRMTDRKKNEPVPSAAKTVMNCPVWLDKIVSQMLHPEARRRPHTATAVGMALDEIKKIDKNKKAAIAQVSGNFNPLTAGSDKSEARRLLGKKKKKNREEEVPFYETAWFLALCLVLIASIATFALWPTSTQKLFDRGVALIESEEPSDWSDGVARLKKVLDRENDEFTDEANRYIMMARRRMLIRRATTGKKSGIQTRFELEFIDAFELEEDDKLEEALEAYQTLVAEYEDNKQKHILEEIKTRIDRLEPYLALPNDPAGLRKLLDEITKMKSEEELVAARVKLVAIVDRFGDASGFSVIIKEAAMLIEDMDVYLDELRSEAASNSSSEPDEDSGGQSDDDEAEDDES